MNIDKAIKKIQYVIADVPAIYSDEVYGALQLGIEALKTLKEYHRLGFTAIAELLPGETKD